MGSIQSANASRLFPQARYQRLPHSSSDSALLTQPLLQDQNKFTAELEHQVQAHWENSSVLEKEIRGLKSTFSRLETMEEAAITSLKEKVDNLKKSLNEEIIGREADKRINSAGFTNQGLALNRLQDKNIEVDKEIAELKTRVDEITSTMLDLAAVVAELKHESLQPKEANEVRITDLGTTTVSKEGLYIVLIFLIALLIGLNL